MSKDFIGLIASDEVLEHAYTWLCDRRKDYLHNDDVWVIRFRWERIKPRLKAELLAGCYRLSPLKRTTGDDGDLDIWAALDAPVLKAIAMMIHCQ